MKLFKIKSDFLSDWGIDTIESPVITIEYIKEQAKIWDNMDYKILLNQVDEI